MYFFFLGRNGPNVTTSVASLVARTKGYKTQNKTKQKQNKSKTKAKQAQIYNYYCNKTSIRIVIVFTSISSIGLHWHRACELSIEVN
jgi:hypothetical protein